jgi:hypothetical protein
MLNTIMLNIVMLSVMGPMLQRLESTVLFIVYACSEQYNLLITMVVYVRKLSKRGFTCKSLLSLAGSMSRW